MLLLLILALLALYSHHTLATSEKPTLPIRHEFKHSIRRPFFIHPLHNANPKNHTTPAQFIPHYSHGGHVVPGPADQTLRLVPSVPRARGVVSSDIAFRGADDNITALTPDMANGWDVHLKFCISPSSFASEAASAGKLNGHRTEGLGMAFWLTSTPLEVYDTIPFDSANPHFGINSVKFDGLRIAVEPIPTNTHPHAGRISSVISFESVKKIVDLGYCDVDMGPQNTMSIISVMYFDKKSELSVWFDQTGTKTHWTHCSTSKIDIPSRGGYISVSAANGDLDRTNDIDLVAMDVFALEPVHRERPHLKNRVTEAQKKHGASGVAYTPDGKVLEHAHQVEDKVQKMMHQMDEENLKKANEALKHPDAPAAAAKKSEPVVPSEGTNTSLSVTHLANLEASVALLSSQVLTASAELLKLKEMIAAMGHPPASNAGPSQADTEWQHTMETKLDRITSMSDTHYQELVTLIHQVRGTGESAHAAASRAHDVAQSAAHAATILNEKPQGPSWMTLFLLMLGAQCVGMVFVTIWRTLRGNNKPKKYL